MPSAQGIRAGRAFVEIFADDARLVKGLTAASRKLKAWGDRMTAVGKKMLLGAGTAALPVAFATQTFMGFEDQMKAVAGVTGATGGQFDLLNEKAKELGRTTSFTAAEVAAGMLNLARSGFAPQEIDAAIAGMLDMARATGTDLAMACDIAAGTLRAFGLEAAQSGRVADVLVATANGSAQTLEDLGESMKYVAPIAEEYGMSLEETSKALGVLANMQIKGSMAGTSMRQAMLQMTDPAVQQQIEALGVRVKDVTGNLRTDFGTMLLELGQAMKGMTNAQRLALFRNLFDQRAAASVAKLAKADFPALARAIDNAAGVAARTALVMDSGLGGGFRRLMSAVEGVQIAVGEALGRTLTRLADYLVAVADRVTVWIHANRGVIVVAAGVLGAVAAMGAALFVLGGVLSATGFMLSTLASLLSDVGIALGAIGTALGAFLSPVGLVIAALASLGAYFLVVSGTGQQALAWLGQQFAALRETAVTAWTAIADALAAGDIGMAARLLWLTLKMEWQKGVAWLTEKWIGFKEAFMAVATEAVYGTAKILTSAWAGLQTAWVETVAFMSKAWTVFTSSLVTGWKTAQNWIAKKFVALMAMFDDTVDVEGAEQILDADFQREQQGRDAATEQQLRDIETTSQARREAIDQQEQGVLDQLDQEKGARHVARKKQYDADLQASEDAVTEARRQWREAMDQAARRRGQGAGIADPENPQGAGPLRDLAGMDLAGMAEKNISVQGTFNAMAARGLGTSGPMERVARSGEETAKNTRKLVQHAQTGELRFS